MMLIFKKKCERYSLCIHVENASCHFFIIDTSDDNIKNLFNKTEWEEIMNVNKKTVLAINKNIRIHLMNYKKKILQKCKHML